MTSGIIRRVSLTTEILATSVRNLDEVRAFPSRAIDVATGIELVQGSIKRSVAGRVFKRLLKFEFDSTSGDGHIDFIEQFENGVCGFIHPLPPFSSRHRLHVMRTPLNCTGYPGRPN